MLLHVHDEARLRLRHKDSATGSPSKSRGSSVQGHVLYLRAGEAAPVDVYRHLEALEHKDAACIATSLERALRDTAKAVAGSVSPGLLRANGGFVENIFFVHILVGDGVSTNQKAARFLWAALRETSLHPSMQYLLLTVICANHQASSL